jgi:hypothetical protein
MKAILFIILFCLTSFKTEPIIRTNRPDLIFDLLDEFIREGNKRGVYVDWFLSSNIHSIMFISQTELNEKYDLNRKPDQGDLLGRVNYRRVNTGIGNYFAYRVDIILSEKILQDEYVLRWVLWHELGHLFGLEHNKKKNPKQNLIMDSDTATDFVIDPAQWKYQNDVFWNKIKDSSRSTWLYAKRNDL